MNEIIQAIKYFIDRNWWKDNYKEEVELAKKLLTILGE